jgi:uncharacterized membrane protein (UPF0127 family)
MQLLLVMLMAAALTTTNVKLPSGKILKVEVATEGADIAKGLLGRESLPQDSGFMLAYRTDVQTQDHLMGYKFPVDILYIDEMKTVINLKENAVPCRTPDCHYLSVWSYRYQLQLPAGTIKRLNIHAGDVLSFSVPGETTTAKTAQPPAPSPGVPSRPRATITVP